MKLRIALGADHGGFALKDELSGRLRDTCEIVDVGAHNFDPADDYPDFVRAAAQAVASGQAQRGILICGSGVGACIAANKVPGVRACLCHDTYSAHQGVEHADMNVLCLGARVIELEQAIELVTAFLKARFSGEGRHQRRLEKVLAIERQALHSGDKSMGTYLADVEAVLADLSQRDVVGRIWQKDHTIWKPDPTEITNRLGWLTITDLMSEQIPALQSFAREVRDAGFRHVVLLGMGGSSLGPEVLRQIFGSAEEYPELIVLDSTVPAWVQSVTEAIDPAHTLFIVSSKSGTTTEPLALFQYFRSLVESAIGEKRTGQNFVAVTDPGTPLAKVAQEKGFRRVFLNPPDIGGRYSVLSYFGLVPAALIGVDIAAVLDRADSMAQVCASSVPVHENPGAWLGACIGTLALKGRDKLTLVASPAISSFGLWVEQLIAESTGKEGKGIIPVVGEPPVAPTHYGKDRLFIGLRLEGDDNSALDAAMGRIKSSGQPLLVLEMKDRYDLGAEFFRWEFTTAVAGAILRIHPFDQPNVQAAKDATERVLQEYTASDRLPPAEATGALADLLAEATKGKYLAIMAYVRQTTEVDDVLAGFRRKVLERYGIATTLGYGPRFLHSTGQLHKGGPDTGLFLQITADHENDLPIPGKPCTFGVVADAQALGDLQALQSTGRHVIRIHSSRSDGATISKLLTGVV